MNRIMNRVNCKTVRAGVSDTSVQLESCIQKFAVRAHFKINDKKKRNSFILSVAASPQETKYRHHSYRWCFIKILVNSKCVLIKCKACMDDQ